MVAFSTLFLTTITTAASLVSCRTNFTMPSCPDSSGPFDLGDVFTGSGAGTYSSSTRAPVDSLSNENAGTISRNSKYFYFTGNQLPVYVIYYGNGFTSNQQNLINNFIANIGSNAYWNVVKSYDSNAATPFLAQSTQINCNGFRYNGRLDSPKGCSMTEYSEMGIVAWTIDNRWLPNNRNAIYMIYGGTDVIYTMSNDENGSGSPQMGDVFTTKGGFCGTHGAIDYDGSGGSYQGYVYTYVQMLRNYHSHCNVIGYLAGTNTYPNGDFVLDNAIALTGHELIEAILSPGEYQSTRAVDNSGNGGSFWDDAGNEAADKCSNMFLNFGQFPNNGNIQVGNQNYIVFPLYNFNSHVCDMGGNKYGGRNSHR